MGAMASGTYTHTHTHTHTHTTYIYAYTHTYIYAYTHIHQSRQAVRKYIIFLIHIRILYVYIISYILHNIIYIS